MHENSLIAYWEGKEELFSKRELAILSAIRKAYHARATDRQVMTVLGFTDPNAVRPRITELVKDGLLSEVGSEVDPITQKTVRVVAIVYRKSAQPELDLGADKDTNLLTLLKDGKMGEAVASIEAARRAS